MKNEDVGEGLVPSRCPKRKTDRLEEILRQPVDMVMSDTVKPRLKPIVEQEVVYA
jgi:predicted nucleotidyltransferase